MPRPRVVMALTRREVLAAVRSPRPFLMAALYLLAQGLLFGTALVADPDTALRTLARQLAWLWLVFGPVIASGALSGEREAGELRSLLCEPISEAELVLAKLLGLLGLALPLCASLVLPAVASPHPEPWILVGLRVLALSLAALASLSLGLLASALASSAGSASLLGLSLVVLAAGTLSRLVPTGGDDPLGLLDRLFRGLVEPGLLVLPILALAAAGTAAGFLRAERRSPRLDPATGTRPPAGVQLLWTLADAARVTSLPLALVLGSGLGLGRLRGTLDLAGYLRLDPGFEAALAALPGPLAIHRVRPASAGGRDALDDLLDEVERAGGGRVEVADLVPAVLQSRLRPLGLLAPPPGGLVVEAGGGLRTVSADRLDVPSREAEEALAEAIGKLSGRLARSRVLFTEGSGERALERRRDDGGVGVSRLASSLRVDGFEVASLWPEEGRTRIDARTILALVGPRHRLEPGALEALDAHLAAGGSLLVSLDPEFPEAAPGILRTLGLLGSPVTGPELATGSGTGTVVDTQGLVAGAGPAALVLRPEARHPLGEPLSNLELVVPSALPLPQPGPPWEVLVRSRPGSWVVAPGQALGERLAWTMQGSHPLVMTRDDGRGRVALLGDSDLASDAVLDAHPWNAAFMASLFAWLARLPPPASVARSGFRVRRVVQEGDLEGTVLAIGAGPALAVLGLGLVAWLDWRRRVARR